MADSNFFDSLPDAPPAKNSSGSGSFFDSLPDKPDAQPNKPTGRSSAGVFAESAARGLPAAGGYWAGAGVGAAAMEMPSAIALATLGPAGPVVAGALELGGGLIGGILGGAGMSAVVDKLNSIMDPEGYDKWKQDQKEHPVAATMGSIASGFAGSSYKTAAEVAGKAWTKPLAQRAISGAAMGGFDAAQQYVETGEVDPLSVGVAAAGGAALPGANVLGKVAHGVGGAIGGVFNPKKPLSSSNMPERPPETATQEEKDAYLNKLKEAVEQRKKTSPLKEAAIRNKETGEIERMGPKHDEARKAETLDTHEQGFVTERGDFLDRREAYDHAKNNGQLPKDHKVDDLDFPDEGLHSGDLRKAGQKDFQITEEQPEGTPREEDKPPVTRDEHKQAIDKLEGQLLDHKLSGDKDKSDEVKNKIDSLKKSMPGVEFKDKARPTWEELHDHLYDAKTVGEALDRVTSSGLGSPTQKTLLKALGKLSVIRDAGISLSDEHLNHTDKEGNPVEHVVGLYHSSSHNVELGKNGHLGTLLHEAVHAGTYKLLQDNKSIAAQRLKALFAKYKESHGDIYRDPKDPKSTHYGFTDVHEFVSEAFSRPSFQRLLRSIEVGSQPKGKIASLWDEFKESVRQGLNLPENTRTALDEVLEQGSAAMEHSEGKYKKEGEALGSGSSAPSVFNLEDEREKRKHEARLAKVGKIELDHLNFMSKLYPEFENPGVKLDPGFKRLREALREKRIAALEKLNTAFEQKDKALEAFQKEGNKENWRAKERAKHAVNAADDELASIREQQKELVDKGTGPRSVPSTGHDEVDEAAKTVDVRSIPDEKSFYEHATDILEAHGEEAAIQFFEDYKKNVDERSIPLPNSNKELDDGLHKMDTFTVKDQSEQVVGIKESNKLGITDEDRKTAFDQRENGEEVTGKLGEILKGLDSELKALVAKAKGMGLKIGAEFETGQNRYRISGGVTSTWKTTVKEFFANKTPMGEKVAEQANEAHERKVFGIKGTNRVVEIHRITKDQTLKYRDKQNNWRTKEVKKGTEIHEWVDGSKKLIAHSDELDFGKESIVPTLDRKSHVQLSDGRVQDIEKHSPYRYLHDAEASSRMAIMGLRKYVREQEYMNNLVKSDFFKKVGHGPDQPLETLPKGWKVPDNIDRIPQLRGWHFDPKTAAIVEDFAKVWDDSLLMKLTNQLVKNMMLNPLPHMFNEMMHLYNARGFTGWVDPRGMARFARTSKVAWNDVMNQSQYYRDIMKEGGSILGATPRNNYFDKLMIESGKQLVDDKNSGLVGLAKKMATTPMKLYNGLSRFSQQAMWISRDVMYVQYIREIQDLNLRRTGKSMDLKDAVEKAGKHMPTYRMPSEVLGSRGLAKVLKNPNVTVFSKYHYGMVKSLVSTLKDLNPKNLKTEEGRQDFKDGADTMLAIGVAMAALYPLMDKMAESLFGEGATQRRAGPYHLIQGGMDVAEGKKDVSALIWPMLTFNPILAVGVQMLVNKKLYSGKEIYHPDDTLPENIEDAGKYLLDQVPQAPPLMSAVNDEGGASSFAAKQMDIKAQTPQQRVMISKAQRRQEIIHKGRETKRQKGTY